MTRQEALGNSIISHMRTAKVSASDAADYVMENYLHKLPDNRKDESIGTETAQAYAAELRNNPDKHAQEMLRAIERGEKLEEDPSGS